jgi:hypothetical protein
MNTVNPARRTPSFRPAIRLRILALFPCAVKPRCRNGCRIRADADISSLLEMLGSIEEPRKEKGRQHGLEFVLAVCFVATLARAKGYSEIAGKARGMPPSPPGTSDRTGRSARKTASASSNSASALAARHPCSRSRNPPEHPRGRPPTSGTGCIPSPGHDRVKLRLKVKLVGIVAHQGEWSEHTSVSLSCLKAAFPRPYTKTALSR